METTTIANLATDVMKPEKVKYDFPLLFVHGMWGGSWVWRNYMNYFSAYGCECYAVNLRGHWGSQTKQNLGAISILDYVDDVRSIVGSFDKSPVLIAHSMGGLIGQKIAEGGGIRAAVLICPAPPKGVFLTGSPSLLLGQIRYLPNLLFKKPLLPSYNLAVKTILNLLNEPNRRQVYDNFVPDSGLAAREITFNEISVDERAIKCPLLVIAAEKDAIIPAKVVRKVAKKYQVEPKEYTNHAHWLIEEDGWEQIANDIRVWIEQKVVQ